MKPFITCFIISWLILPDFGYSQRSQTFISGQTWSTRNLNTKKFRNGDPIRQAKSNEEWIAAAARKEPAWCYYENNAEYGKVFGILYNWYAVNDPRGLAPAGWHVATEQDWELLFQHIGNKSLAGIALKSRTHWPGSGAGADTYGFNGLPGGNRFEEGTFDGVNEYSGWWTMTEYDEEHAFDINISDRTRRVWSYQVVKADGLYVRCVKNEKKAKVTTENAGAKAEVIIDHDDHELHGKIATYTDSKVKLAGINSPASDIAPTVYSGWLYFGSKRFFKSGDANDREDIHHFYNLLAAPLDGGLKEVTTPTGTFGLPEHVIKVGNFEGPSLPNGLYRKHHDALLHVAPNRNLLFITTNWAHEKPPREYRNMFSLMIYFCEKKGSTWSNPEPLPFNGFEWNTQNPWFDEVTGTLYFSSNRPGGFGGYDLYKSLLRHDGSWSAPENLGNKINTEKDEVFPSLSPDRRLFFASNGWPGLGGLDTFLFDEQLARPLNLLEGINSESDDFYLHFTSTSSGFLTSNRKGGAGDDDIYLFEADFNQDRLREYNLLQGSVQFVGQSKSKVFPSATAAVDGPTGNSEFIIPAEGTTQVLVLGSVIRVSAFGYHDIIVNVDDDMIRKGAKTPVILNFVPLVESNLPTVETPAETTNTESTKAVEAVPPVVKAPSIYFDFGSIRIRKDAAQVLDYLVQLLKDQKDLYLEVRAHADCRGKTSFNQLLSERRADAVIRYISKKLGENNRVNGKGFGETLPANECNCESVPEARCTTADYASNIRAEFVFMRR